MNTIKTVVFISNFFNHHQKPFSDAMYEKLGSGYFFIETSVMSTERKSMGWGMEQYPSYVVPSTLFSKNRDKYDALIERADVVIFGSAPHILLKKRISQNKLIFRYSERPLKKGLQLWRCPDRFVRWRMMYPPRANIHLLCASAYAACDYALFGLFSNRCYKWGYFPKTEYYDDIDKLIASKKENSLIWVARFIDWKHPEIAVKIATRLKSDGYRFSLRMIGNGQLMEKTAELVRKQGLEDVVHLLGSMTPEEVRRHMESSQIHLFTSDRNEGWGAVLNESMNSACVPVANCEIGSAPYLINDGQNGYLYDSFEGMYERVKYLLDNAEQTRKMARAAYHTIVTQWNAEVAAERIVALSESILYGHDYPVTIGCGSKEGT